MRLFCRVDHSFPYRDTPYFGNHKVFIVAHRHFVHVQFPCKIAEDRYLVPALIAETFNSVISPAYVIEMCSVHIILVFERSQSIVYHIDPGYFTGDAVWWVCQTNSRNGCGIADMSMSPWHTVVSFPGSQDGIRPPFSYSSHHLRVLV